jgi:hypothetical protein
MRGTNGTRIWRISVLGGADLADAGIFPSKSLIGL